MTSLPMQTTATSAPLVVLAGGGTGGHVTPALAMADAFVAAGWRVRFLGTEQGFEARMVPARGYDIAFVPGSRLVGGGLSTKIRGLRALWQGIQVAKSLLVQWQPQLVIGVGGYASGAALLAARWAGIHTAIHESNAVPGLTNKVLGNLVDRVYLGFAAALVDFPREVSMVSGNPVRPEIAKVGPARQIRMDRPARVLITGGSQGAQFLNERLPPLLALVSATGLRLEIRHQIGKQDPAPVAAAYEAAGLTAELFAFTDDMAGYLAWADFAVTRSGSGTVAELAAAGLPALLVPFPHAAGDHQAANAKAFCDAGAGWWARQEEWNEGQLAANLAEMLKNRVMWQAASDAALGFALPDAARAVVRDSGQWLGLAGGVA
jgi:UDP-N-acetylglucosamine--N-acetylmuramyl-(pentapeptide) pyrophosphoryl-undecaprenol N-acetylglucosamine transferase